MLPAGTLVDQAQFPSGAALHQGTHLLVGGQGDPIQADQNIAGGQSRAFGRVGPFAAGAEIAESDDDKAVREHLNPKRFAGNQHRFPVDQPDPDRFDGDSQRQNQLRACYGIIAGALHSPFFLINGGNVARQTHFSVASHRNFIRKLDLPIQGGCQYHQHGRTQQPKAGSYCFSDIPHPLALGNLLPHGILFAVLGGL